MSLLGKAHEIIDSSQGFIETDNDEVENLFQEIFDIARGIVQHNYLINHSKTIMKNQVMIKN